MMYGLNSPWLLATTVPLEGANDRAPCRAAQRSGHVKLSGTGYELRVGRRAPRLYPPWGSDTMMTYRHHTLAVEEPGRPNALERRFGFRSKHNGGWFLTASSRDDRRCTTGGSLGPDDKIVVSHLSKIFGPHPEEALDLLDQGVHKDEIFARTQTTVGVRDVSLSISAGEVFVVMGLSGSGKSTLVRTINRLIDPTVGEVLIDGQDITKMSEKELVEHRRNNTAMVFQSFALLPHLTALENAAFGLEIAGVDREERQERAMEVLKEVNLEGYAGSYPDELSGGMQQRVGLARALAVDPSILLMDEAYSALDPLIRREMQEELLELQARKERTVVFISHDLDEAMRIGDRIAMMEGGAVTQVGTPREILEHPAADYIREFFQDVDVGEVYAAEHATDQEVVVFRDGRGTSPDAMRRTLEEQGADYGYVLDERERFVGVVSADALDAGERGAAEATYLPDPTVVRSGTQLGRILGKVASSSYPVPVVRRDGSFLGAVSRNSLLSTLERKT